MNKKRLFSLAIIVALCLAAMPQIFADASSLVVESNIGFDGISMMGKNIPLIFNIQNNGSDIDGEIHIELPINDGNYYQEIVVPIQIASGTSQTVKTDVRLNVAKPRFPFRITSGGKEIYKDNVLVEEIVSPDTVFMGVIADSADNYMPYNYTRLPKIQSDFFFDERSSSQRDPDYWSTLKVAYLKDFSDFNIQSAFSNFDYILIGESSQLKLTEDTEQLLIDWVESGGVLFIEAGENYQKIMSSLPDSLKRVEFSGIKEVTYSSEFYGAPFDLSLKIATGKPADDMTHELKQGEDIFGYETRLGKGHIITINTMLSQTQLQEWHKENDYIGAIISNFAKTIEEQIDILGFSHWYAVEDAISYIDGIGELPFGTIGTILFIYMIIVGPVLYFVLKRIDRRGLLWFIGPALAMLTLVLIAFIGKSAWGNKPIINSLSVVKYNQGSLGVDVNTSMAIFNNQNDKLKVKWNDEDIAFDEINNDYYGPTDAPRMRKSTIFKGDNQAYYNYDTKLWQHTVAYAKKNILLESPEIKGEFKTASGDPLFTFTNNTPIDLKYAKLLRGDIFYELGNIDANSVVDVDLSTADFRYFDQHSSSIPPSKYSSEEQEDYEKFNELLYRLGISPNSKKGYIFAHNDMPIGYDLVVNDSETVKFDNNIVIYQFDLEREKGVTIEIDLLDVEFDAKASNGFESYSVYFYADDMGMVGEVSDVKSLSISHILPSEFKAENVAIDFEYSARDFDENQTDISYWVYNQKTLEYDLITLDDDSTWVDIDIDKHLSDANEIRTKIEFNSKRKYIGLKQLDIKATGVFTK